MFDYFKLVENKYINRLSISKPIVIRLDGKDICGNPDIDILDETNGGFAYALINTGKFLSIKYKCIVYVTTDEINIVVENPEILKKLYKKLEAQKISTLVSQEVFIEFNKHYNGDRVLFDARTFNLYENKINSYLLHRKSLGNNVFVNHFAKEELKFDERVKVPLKKIEDKLYKISYRFRNRTEYQTQGLSFKNGKPIEILSEGYKYIVEENNKCIIKKFDNYPTEDDLI